MAKKKSKKQTTKKVAKSASIVKTEDGTRLKKLTKRQSKNLKKTKQRQAKLPNAWVILKQSLTHLWCNKRLFGGILLVYGVLYILFVKGISANFQLGNLKQSLENTFSGKLSTFSSGVALYGLLLGSASDSSSQSGSIFQTILVIIVSLALIWALRQTYAGTVKHRIRDSYYKSTYPLVPFLAVCFVILIQFLPALTTVSLYNVIASNSIAVGGPQRLLALIILGLGLLWTVYMLSSSVFALYIVTLPDATPRASLKAAKKLVQYRRSIIMRKIAILPIALLFFSAVILIPLIIMVPLAAELIFIVFTISVIAIIHSYLYTLYRSLL